MLTHTHIYMTLQPVLRTMPKKFVFVCPYCFFAPHWWTEMVLIPSSHLSVIDKYPRFFCSSPFPPFSPCFYGCSHWRFVLLSVQVELSHHAEGQTNAVQQHMDCTWMSRYNTLLCFFLLSISLILSPSHPLALSFVFVPGLFEGVFQNRRYWHWSPNQMQASHANWNHKGRAGGREKGEGLASAWKGIKIFSTQVGQVYSKSIAVFNWRGIIFVF